MNLVHSIEIPAVVTGLANIYLATRISQLNWLFGAISVMFYAIIFYQTKLYADMVLQGIYLLFQLYGWLQWQTKYQDETSLPIKKISRKNFLIGLISFMSLFSLSYFFLSHYTDSTTVIADSLITALSLIAQWMMCNKWIENWSIWIVVDSISIILYLFKHLYLTSGLYVLLLVLCIMGYKQWKSCQDEKATAQVLI
ncbi:MAG: nicotinamide riboside transporter PnuC [Gammaproteobacteria bacterium]|nr:nicotinamide riboside transporter PnuC [Gammaproteobacteria bacterium]